MYHEMTLNTKPAALPNDLIGSVQRSLNILELLAQYSEGLNAKQVSRQVKVNLSTCYHLINTLMVSGYIVKDPDTLLFRLSGKIGYTIHGKASPAQLVKNLTPNIYNLKETTNETAYLSIWDGEEIMTAAVAESPLSVRVRALEVGFCEANHATALGKAVLAYFDEDQIDPFLSSHGMSAYTSNTITSAAAFKVHLAKVRRQGFSLDLEEYFPDVFCIGAPIFDAEGKILASVAIALPGSRYHQSGDKLLPKIMRTAKDATRTMRILGYVGQLRIKTP